MADIQHRAALRLQLEQRLEQFGRPPAASETEVGSSRMISFGFCSSARTISMRWRSPTERSATCAVRIERQPVSCATAPTPPRRSGSSEMPGVERQRDVFGDRQGLEQREMLEDHADAELAGFARRWRSATGFPSQRISPAGRLQNAEQHLHQRGLACAVLSEKRVDLAWSDIEIDFVAGGKCYRRASSVSGPTVTHRTAAQIVNQTTRSPHFPLPTLCAVLGSFHGISSVVPVVLLVSRSV